MPHKIKNMPCVCVWVGVREGRGRGEGKKTRGVIHLFQTALKNLANKYFHFGQFFILFSVVYSGLSYEWTRV